MVGFLTCCLKFGSLNKTKRENISCKIWGWKEQSMKWERGLERELEPLLPVITGECFICMQPFPEELWSCMSPAAFHGALSWSGVTALEHGAYPTHNLHPVQLHQRECFGGRLSADLPSVLNPLWEGSRACNFFIFFNLSLEVNRKARRNYFCF